MIAEEENINELTEKIPTTVEEGSTLSKIQSCIEGIYTDFVAHVRTLENLNEEQLTQEFVIIMNRKVHAHQYPFLAQPEYRDIHHGSRGRSDLFFYPSEEGESTESIFSVEAKRLPSPPPVAREREYVIGDNRNGGIERYKNGAHGRGLKECGMLGYIEDESVIKWMDKINGWITDLASTNPTEWHEVERLDSRRLRKDFHYLTSIVNKFGGEQLSLHHFWIKIK